LASKRSLKSQKTGKDFNKDVPNTKNGCKQIYLAKGGSPQKNIEVVLDMMGGIEKFIGPDDIVIIKPNAQWWNQGRTNLAAIKGFIDLVLNISGFKGEIIIAENHHFMDESAPEGEKDNVRGWTHLSEINGDIDGANHNLNTLIKLYKGQGNRNVTKYHWRDGGPKRELWGNGQKGGGNYLPEKPVKIGNFAVLNTHGDDTGITSSIKNYMGITDLSCGYGVYSQMDTSTSIIVGEAIINMRKPVRSHIS
jgi:hypothetical protein